MKITCLKCAAAEVAKFAGQQHKTVGQGYSLRPYLFSIFTEYICKHDSHAPVTGTTAILQYHHLQPKVCLK